MVRTVIWHLAIPRAKFLICLFILFNFTVGEGKIKRKKILETVTEGGHQSTVVLNVYSRNVKSK